MLVITGATGVVGGGVARLVAERGEPTRLLVRDPSRLPELPGAERARGTYDDAAALAAALAPGDRVFMVSMHAAYDERLRLHRAFIDAAVRARVGRVVYLSFVGAGPEASFLHARSHGATERMLAESGLPYTAVRNGMYADELPAWFDAEGRITGFGGEGRVSFTWRPELSAAIAALLLDPAHDGREVVTITTPDAVSLPGLAALARELTGDPYRYEPQEREAWVAYRRSLGRPDWSIEAGASYYDGVARGEADVVTDDYRVLTGEEPLPIRAILERVRERLPLGSR